MALRPGGCIRVMLVDRHRMVLWGLQKLVNGQKPGMEVVATGTDWASSLELADKAAPDVVVVDAGLLRDNPADLPALINGRGTRVLAGDAAQGDRQGLPRTAVARPFHHGADFRGPVPAKRQ